MSFGMAELDPGQIFAGRYEVQRILGEGDRKRTYRARDTKLGRLVALSPSHTARTSSQT